MTIRTCRVPFAAAICLGALVAAALACPARSQPREAADDSYIAAITADDVPVRCGAADSYYPFGKLKDGDLLKVIGEKFNWIRVLTIGPAFDDFFGYVCLPKTDAGRFRLDADGKKGRTLGPVDLRAPNLNTRYDPRNSWKAILVLEPDVELTVLETTETERQIVHKVQLPKNAEGWISASFVRKATPEQVAAWTAAMTRPRPEPDAGEIAGHQPAEEAESVLAREEQAVAPVADQPTADETRAEKESTEPTSPEQDETTAPAGAGQAAEAAAEAPSPPPAAPSAAQARLEDLEAAYDQLLKEPIETAEVLPLRDLYLKLAEDHPESKRIVRYVSARAGQLALWADLQERRAELTKLRKRLELSAEEAEAMRLALETTADYAAVGRLAASTVYDGQRLPKLFRIQDASTGRTIAYLRLDDEFHLAEMLGQLVGIVGKKTYDNGLRLNVIEPKRIDLLTPQR